MDYKLSGRKCSYYVCTNYHVGKGDTMYVINVWKAASPIEENVSDLEGLERLEGFEGLEGLEGLEG